MKSAKVIASCLGGASFLYTGHRVIQDGRLDLNNFGLVRFGRAAVTVGRIGLDYKLSANAPDPEPGEGSLKAVHRRSAAKLLALCRANGGCFTKVGQHIGALDYLLPEEYVATLRVLHSNAPQMDLDDIYAVIREDLGQEASEVFKSFDSEPLGTASLAQVHKARLRGTGEEVAVKVQHRYVKQHSFVDIQTMNLLVRLVKFVFPQFEFMWLADEMKKNLPLELSFMQEGRNAEKISNMLGHFGWLKVPSIHWHLSTDRVLVMEFCSGGHVNDVDYMVRNGIDTRGVSTKIGRLYADMIFNHGYVHCDPHPGNVLVSKSESGHDQIILLDHGLYTQLTKEFRLNYAQFWLSILNADLAGIRSTADRLGVGQLYGLFACMVTGRSWGSILKGIDKAEKTPDESKEVKENAARYLKEIADVLAFVNRQMILIFKTNDLLRNIEFTLGTQHNMASFVQMSRSCMRVLRADELRNCRSIWCTFRVCILAQWDQIRITFYQAFLWLWWSSVGRFTRKLTGN